MMLFSNQGPWYMAKCRKAFVQFVTAPMRYSTEFLNTWNAVKKPEGKPGI